MFSPIGIIVYYSINILTLGSFFLPAVQVSGQVLLHLPNCLLVPCTSWAVLSESTEGEENKKAFYVAWSWRDSNFSVCWMMLSSRQHFSQGTDCLQRYIWTERWQIILGNLYLLKVLWQPVDRNSLAIRNRYLSYLSFIQLYLHYTSVRHWPSSTLYTLDTLRIIMYN